jgi:hypothetical protein
MLIIKESLFIIFTLIIINKKIIDVKTQRRAQRGTKYHAAPTKTAQPAPNAARTAL